jgi:syntaxin 16
MDTVQPKIPDDYSDSQGGLFEEKENEFSEVAKVREEGINVLVNNISELALIFKELNMLVLDQGTILDRIDYNLTLSKENSKNAVKQLVSAQKSQNCTRAASCLLFLIVLIVLLLLLLIFKHF